MKFRILVTTVFISLISFAQKMVSDSIIRKKITAIKVNQSPKIDGVLDDKVWKNVPIASNFIERSPNNGKMQPEEFKTEVKVLYDDTGVYFSAEMSDPNPKNIQKELTERDNIGNDDAFGISINGYNDKQQDLLFIITAAGVQSDAKVVINSNDDFSWNAIWQSAVKITDKGWTVEMKIPYSELRFPKKNVQEWGINFTRIIQKTNQNTTWNFVDNKKGSYLLYDGILQGIENIKTATRLSFLPYFSTYYNNYSGKNTTQFNGGMDVKYGINDAFTLDTTLIPDFGQTNFDPSVLNLTPFETHYQEQRSFFTEGTELFSKGNLFYSRRIGGAPSTSAQINANEEVIDNPSKVNLFNATKVSGRTNKGLGIGVFNAITEKAEATIKNDVTNETRKEVIEPRANYNVLVLDQRFNGNSSVTFVNTNTMREGSYRDANATALMFDLTNKKNTYNYFGGTKGSWVFLNGTTFGNETYGGISKISGKNRFNTSFDVVDKNYNIDDLGYTGPNNFYQIAGNYTYRYLQPKGNINNLNYNVNFDYKRRLETDLFYKLNIETMLQLTNKKFENYGVGFMTNPFGTNDIYEPRTFGRYLKTPALYNPWIFYNSDQRKKFFYNFVYDTYFLAEKDRHFTRYFMGLRYRFSDHYSVSWNGNAFIFKNEKGFASNDGTNIIIGRRDNKSFENVITSQYTFNDKMMLNLSFRHYFSDVTYKQFYNLNLNGTLQDNTIYAQNNNITYNAWNVDLRFSWWFAPGSQLTLLYRNAINNYLNISGLGFNENFNKLFAEPMVNNLSLKLTYYIDYNRAKNCLK